MDENLIRRLADEPKFNILRRIGAKIVSDVFVGRVGKEVFEENGDCSKIIDDLQEFIKEMISNGLDPPESNGALYREIIFPLQELIINRSL